MTPAHWVVDEDLPSGVTIVIHFEPDPHPETSSSVGIQPSEPAQRLLARVLADGCGPVLGMLLTASHQEW